MTGFWTIRRGRRLLLLLATAAVLCVLLMIPSSANVNPLSGAFNPRGMFLTTTDGTPYWLRSVFVTGFYRDASGGGSGDGTGGGGVKDELGHSNIQYAGTESGLDYIDAEDVTKIYAITDHNPVEYRFIVGYSKTSDASGLSVIPDFTSLIGTPERRTITDPSGSQWWSIPIDLTTEKGSLAEGTLYEFAFLRGMRANNGTSCVLAEGNKGYVAMPFTAEEQALYDAHKYDEYEFITAIYPAGSASSTDVEHTLDTVPMRYWIQTYSNTSSWTDSDTVAAVREFLASSETAAGIASGKYSQAKVDALSQLLADQETKIGISDNTEDAAFAAVRRLLQDDAETEIKVMLEELQTAMDDCTSGKADLTDYYRALKEAQDFYALVKDQGGTAEGQYAPEKIDALRAEIDKAMSTINENSRQSDVDAERDALDGAVLTVKLSQVRADTIVFYDPATGVYVSVPRGAVPDNVQLVVREFADGTPDMATVYAALPAEVSVASAFRILFYDGVNIVEPTQPATVQIPIRATLSGLSTTTYFLTQNNNVATVIASSKTGTYQVLTTQQMGTFAIGGTEVPAGDGTPSNTSGNLPSGNNYQPSGNTSRTTRVMNTAPSIPQNQSQRNEREEQFVPQTQPVEDATKPELREDPDVAGIDRTDLQQEANDRGILYIAVALALMGSGSAAVSAVRERRGKDDTDEEG